MTAVAILAAGAAWSQPVGAQAGMAGGVAEYDTCRARTEALAARLDSLVAREVLAWEERRSAIASAARAQELRVLARGDALGDTLRTVADAFHATDRECRRMGDALLASVEEEIAALAPGGPGSRPDSLRSLRRRLVTERAARRSADLTAPVARPDDGPDVLRVKALRARDLADRAAAWRADVAAIKREAEDRQRLAEEQRELQRDLSFFETGAALDTGSPPPHDPAGSGLALADSSAITRLLQALMAGGGPRLQARTPLEALGALDSWLARKEDELARSAADLDSLAAGWGREP